MRNKVAKALRREAKQFARQTGRTKDVLKAILHRPRLVNLGWKEREVPTSPPKKITNILKEMWGWLKRMANPEQEQKTAAKPKEYTQDIQTVTPETLRYTSGPRFFYLQFKKAFMRGKLSV